MSAFKPVLFAVTLLMGMSAAKAQTAEEVVAKHIEAIGGKDKISQIKSVYMENTMEVMGNEAPSTTTILNGKGFKNETDFNGQKIVSCVTDKGGWSINPMAGQTTPTAMTPEQVKAAQDQLYVGGPLFNYAEKGNKLAMGGKESVNGVDALKVKVTSKDNVESTYFIDPTSYYIIKAIRKQTISGQDMEVTMLFSNYQKTDYGYVVPFTTEMQLPQFTLKYNTKKVEINKPVDESIFKGG